MYSQHFNCQFREWAFVCLKDSNSSSRGGGSRTPCLEYRQACSCFNHKRKVKRGLCDSQAEAAESHVALPSSTGALTSSWDSLSGFPSQKPAVTLWEARATRRGHVWAIWSTGPLSPATRSSQPRPLTWEGKILQIILAPDTQGTPNQLRTREQPSWVRDKSSPLYLIWIPEPQKPWA